ncbi:MAG: phosphoenolpyruvate--protein phosphotransferase [Clostridiales bacterium]|jgi:phosphotransferase system enzyme I (PtsI)|nr:phosphoenolpyruvate--protein phosphotransferase [Clostridiales bacterium]
MLNFKGIGVSPGIAMGHVLLIEKKDITIPKHLITDEEAVMEIEKFEAAKKGSMSQVEKIIEKTKATMGADKAGIFESQLEIINDPMFNDSVLDKVRNSKNNILHALEQARDEFVAIFESMDDEYFRERTADVKDVVNRVINNALGINQNYFDNLDKDVIVVANDLTPSDTASMDFNYVLGFATEIGGRTSHSSIMARSLEIPAVVGIGKSLFECRHDDYIILDGEAGLLFVNPDEAIINEYKMKKEQFLAEKAILAELKELPAKTTDGKVVELCANIGGASDLKGAFNNGAEGVGLFRTEFLYMNNTNFPSEDEQFNVYKEVASQINVIIRTLDIGGDKDLPYYEFEKEMNPFLGWRALRICLDKTEIFKTQLRAILRASAFGKIRIMYPMIISLEELRKANSILAECKKELSDEGTAYDEKIEAGIMVETPAAAIMADLFIKEADFFSIGTNDLTQYLLAVDRGNEKVSKLYNTFNPAVLRAIKNIIDASHKEGKWTGMCGEFAGEKKAAVLLLGMGLDEFSMSAISIPSIKKIIRGISFESAKEIAENTLKLSTAEEVEKYLSEVCK